MRDYFIGGAVFLHHGSKCYLPGSLCIVNNIGAQCQDQCFSTVFFTMPHPQSLLDIIFLVIPSPWETLLPNLESQYVFKYFSVPHSFSFLSMILTTQMPGLFCHLCVLSLLIFLQPFFSLFEGWIISTEVSSSSFSYSSPSCHWVFVDSFKFWWFYFSVIQFPFGSYL